MFFVGEKLCRIKKEIKMMIIKADLVGEKFFVKMGVFIEKIAEKSGVG
ncbi:MAG: hypothetical protein SNJ71_00660 [Bacteroidales bacterium]